MIIQSLSKAKAQISKCASTQHANRDTPPYRGEVRQPKALRQGSLSVAPRILQLYLELQKKRGDVMRKGMMRAKGAENVEEKGSLLRRRNP